MPKFMYKVVAKVRDGSSFMYKVYNNAIQRYCVLSREELYNAALIDSVENVVARKGTVRGINGFRLSDLPFVHESIKSASMPRPFSSIDYAINDESRPIYDAQYASLKPRRQLKELEDFIKANSYINVCAIYGLRRTGKTVLMYQMMAKLNFRDCFFATLKDTSTYEDLKGLLDYCVTKKLKYVFLDEITAMPDFLPFAAMFANYYAARGLVITLAGTDSYKLWLAERHPLYDRCNLIEMRSINYAECCNLMGHMSIFDYIVHFGGVLEKDIFYDIQKAYEYIDTSISSNIYKSMDKYANIDDRYEALITSGAFKQIMEKVIEKKNGVLTATKLISAFKSADIGNVVELLPDYFDNVYYKNAISSGSIQEKLLAKLNLYSVATRDIEKLIKKHTSAAYELLQQLYVLTPVLHYNGDKVDTEFVMPFVGLRYAHTKNVLNILSRDINYKALGKTKQQLLKDRLLSCAFGSILEHIVLQHLISIYDIDSVYMYNYSGAEYDCVVTNGSAAYIMEIKWSTKQVDNQCKYLVSKEYYTLFKAKMGINEIAGRFVLYRGVTQHKVLNNIEVDYINVEDFLLNTKAFITKF